MGGLFTNMVWTFRLDKGGEFNFNSSVTISFSRRNMLHVVGFHLYRLHSVKADSQTIKNGDELRICKEVALVYFIVPSQHQLRKTTRNHQKFSIRIASSQDEGCTRHLKNTYLKTYLHNRLTLYSSKEIYVHSVFHESVQSTSIEKKN